MKQAIPELTSKHMWGMIIVILFSIPFLSYLAFGTYLLLGIVFGIVQLIAHMVHFRITTGKNAIHEGYKSALEKANGYDRVLIERNERNVKLLTYVFAFGWAMITYGVLWPGMLFYDLLVFTFPNLRPELKT